MVHFRIMAGLLALSLAAGCKAQTAPATPTAATDLNRRIGVLVRSQFSLPPDVTVTVGQRKASDVQGYDTLPVTLTRGARSQNVDFLISKDGKKLAHLDTFNIIDNPVFNIDVAGRPVRGNPNAKVTVINFDDLECPYCARMHQELFPTTLDHYKDKIRIVYKDDPLTEIHPWAMHAAVDANCLAQQSPEVYWKYVDYLHGHGQEVTGQTRDLDKSKATLDRIAKEEGTVAKLDSAKLDACLAKQDETQIRASSAQAEQLGVQGTPALFIDGERVEGAMPAQQLWEIIDRALKDAGEQPPPREPAAPPQAQSAPAAQPKPAQP